MVHAKSQSLMSVSALSFSLYRCFAGFLYPGKCILNGNATSNASRLWWHVKERLRNRRRWTTLRKHGDYSQWIWLRRAKTIKISNDLITQDYSETLMMGWPVAIIFRSVYIMSKYRNFFHDFYFDPLAIFDIGYSITYRNDVIAWLIPVPFSKQLTTIIDRPADRQWFIQDLHLGVCERNVAGV